MSNTNPCPICNKEHPDYSGCCGIEVRENGVNVLSMATREWNHYTDDFDYVYLEVNYCPKCGRDLKGEGE